MSFDITGPIFPHPARDSSGLIAGQSIAVSTSAISAGTAYDAKSVRTVTFDIQAQDVRVRFDGVNPTSTVGHILPSGTAYEWSVDRFNNAIFIRSSAATGDATIFASPDAS